MRPYDWMRQGLYKVTKVIKQDAWINFVKLCTIFPNELHVPLLALKLQYIFKISKINCLSLKKMPLNQDDKYDN